MKRYILLGLFFLVLAVFSFFFLVYFEGSKYAFWRVGLVTGTLLLIGLSKVK